MSRPTRLSRAEDAFSRIAAHILSPDDHTLLVEAMKAEGLRVTDNSYLAHVVLMSESARLIGEEAHKKNSTHEFMDPREILKTIHTYTGEMYWEPRNG